ncbi:MAG: hypothetical protein ACR2Q4_19855 [Geminicoccaceae bacterium]
MKRRTLMASMAVLGSGAALGSSVLPSWGQSQQPAGYQGGLGFDTGLRRLHVSPSQSAPIDGALADATFTTIQAALDTAAPGDVITVASGIYRERPTIIRKAGTGSLPIWLVAEQRGGVILSDTWQEAEQGEVAWADHGSGVYSAPRNVRPYIGEHAGDFLMAYLSETDLRANTITAYSAIAGADRRIKKPPYGFAFDPYGQRVYIRLRDGIDPNGQAIKLTGTFARNIITVTKSSHLIIDGFVLEGAGDTQGISLDNDCSFVTVRNCVFGLARHGVRCPSDTILDSCTYRYVGFDRWVRDLFALDGTGNNGVFVLLKGYYHADAAGVSGGKGNALLEGSIDYGYNFPYPQTNILIDRCLIGPCFDGSRIGEFNGSEIRHSVFLECRDDGFQNEGPKGKPSADNRIHDCRFINCYHDGSHQGKSIAGNVFVYRNLFEWNDPELAIPGNYSIKTISTPRTARVFYYHNSWLTDYGGNVGGSLGVWADFGGPRSNADQIDCFVNNIVVMPEALADGTGTNPKIIAGNAVVGPSTTAKFLTVNGGVFAGETVADMGLRPDGGLFPDSPARAIARPLPKGLPDSRQGPGAKADAGAFPFGETPGPDWPRPKSLAFNYALPGRWPSPGV